MTEQFQFFTKERFNYQNTTLTTVQIKRLNPFFFLKEIYKDKEFTYIYEFIIDIYIPYLYVIPINVRVCVSNLMVVVVLLHAEKHCLLLHLSSLLSTFYPKSIRLFFFLINKKKRDLEYFNIKSKKVILNLFERISSIRLYSFLQRQKLNYLSLGMRIALGPGLYSVIKRTRDKLKLLTKSQIIYTSSVSI